MTVRPTGKFQSCSGHFPPLRNSCCTAKFLRNFGFFCHFMHVYFSFSVWFLLSLLLLLLLLHDLYSANFEDRVVGGGSCAIFVHWLLLVTMACLINTKTGLYSWAVITTHTLHNSKLKITLPDRASTIKKKIICCSGLLNLYATSG